MIFILGGFALFRYAKIKLTIAKTAIIGIFKIISYIIGGGLFISFALIRGMGNLLAPLI